MNKYLLRGLIYTGIGIGLCAVGYTLMNQEINLYKWVMAAGVVLFGFGFITIVYSFIRKIERRSIIEERKDRRKDDGQT